MDQATLRTQKSRKVVAKFWLSPDPSDDYYGTGPEFDRPAAKGQQAMPPHLWRAHRRSLALTAVLAVATGSMLGASQTLVSGTIPAPDASKSQVWSDVADGFAATDGTTTGGTAGETVTVTTYEDLVKYSSAGPPYVIKVAGTVEIPYFAGQVRVASDKTLVGVGRTGAIANGGFSLDDGVSNVIIRNLTFKEGVASSGIELGAVDHVWIDHNSVSRVSATALDLLSDISNVTLSWNILNGHGKDLGIDWAGVGTTKITLHHNRLINVRQLTLGAQELRYAHLYNNYLEDVESVVPGPLVNSTVLLEQNYVEDVGDLNRNSAIGKLAEGEPFEPSDSYAYVLDQPATLPSRVTKYAGPQVNIGR